MGFNSKVCSNAFYAASAVNINWRDVETKNVANNVETWLWRHAGHMVMA